MMMMEAVIVTGMIILLKISSVDIVVNGLMLLAKSGCCYKDGDRNCSSGDGVNDKAFLACRKLLLHLDIGECRDKYNNDGDRN